MRYILIICFFSLYGAAVAQMRVVHVLVALCDNKNQGIVPVPEKIGNGQDPGNNLYWGCGYGVRTFLKKQADWKLIKTIKNPAGHIFERIIFKHNTTDTWLVADAYDGAYIKNTVTDFLDYCAGKRKSFIRIDSATIKTGGDANLICYVGHNGLMDFSLEEYPANSDGHTREAAIFACASKSYFKPWLQKAGAQPLIWTTHLMCPEAYTLVAMVDGWIKKQDPSKIREAVAQSYNKYHKCGIKGARNLFVTGW